jgi:SpoVK/Ycf46/Vps4 family AAA+-type ATPase
VDAITPHRETAQKDMERRIVAQLLSSLDGLFTMSLSKIFKSKHFWFNLTSMPGSRNITD